MHADNIFFFKILQCIFSAEVKLHCILFITTPGRNRSMPLGGRENKKAIWLHPVRKKDIENSSHLGGRGRWEEGRNKERKDREIGRRGRTQCCEWTSCMETPVGWVEISRKVLGEPGIPLLLETMKAYERAVEICMTLHDVQRVEQDCEKKV